MDPGQRQVLLSRAVNESAILAREGGWPLQSPKNEFRV